MCCQSTPAPLYDQTHPALQNILLLVTDDLQAYNRLHSSLTTAPRPLDIVGALYSGMLAGAYAHPADSREGHGPP